MTIESGDMGTPVPSGRLSKALRREKIAAGVLGHLLGPLEPSETIACSEADARWMMDKFGCRRAAIVRAAVGWADALIEELDKEKP